MSTVLFSIYKETLKINRLEFHPLFYAVVCGGNFWYYKYAMLTSQLFEMQKPILHVPIGPSGSGKSTLFRKLKKENPQILEFSLDTLRHEWYDPHDYHKAWKASTEDPDFLAKSKDYYIDLLDHRKDIFVDNTNLSPKVRRFYLEMAKLRGYQTVAYVFDVPIETLLARQHTRGDKNVPEDAVRRQHRSFTKPLEGEFDEVIEL